MVRISAMFPVFGGETEMTSLEETIASYNARISVHLQNIATSEMIINELKTIQDDSGDIEMNRQLIASSLSDLAHQWDIG
jgi:hypothetical protein